MVGLCAIVGAGEGLGSALAARFALGASERGSGGVSGAGFDLALISRSSAGSATAIEAARTARPEARIRHMAADATDPAGLEAALGAIAREMGEIDVLIYNVRGAFTPAAPLDLSYDALEETLRLEVIGAFAAAKAVLPAMRARGTGMIFFSSATAAFRGSARFPHYAVGKFALRGLSQSLAKAYGPDGVHIAHMRLDCDLDVPVMRRLYGDAYDPAKLAQPADVAETYWLTYQQPPGAWSNEVDIRPATETWTC